MKYRYQYKVIMGLGALCLLGCADSSSELPDVAKKPVELEMHDHVRVDDYYWLNERDNPEVIAYLEAENAYVDAQLADDEPLRQQLIDEMAARYVDNSDSAPYAQGNYEYYWRYEPNADYANYYRRQIGHPDSEELLLDVVTLAGEAAYFDVAEFSVSPDNRTAAYAVDTVGRRFYDIRFIDLDSGEHLSNVVPSITPDFVWSADSTHVYYTRQHPDTLRWYQTYRYGLADDTSTKLFEESDETFNTSVYKSLSGAYVYVNSYSTTSTETHYLAADDNDAELTLFRARKPNHEYSLTDGGEQFFVLSNRDAVNFQLFSVPLTDTSDSSWSVVVPHRDDVLISDYEVFGHSIVMLVRRDGRKGFEIVSRITGDSHNMLFDEEGFDAYIGYNVEYDAGMFRYTYSSMTTPYSTIDYDFLRGSHNVIKQQQVGGGYAPADYETESRTATARDGTEVPVTLVYRKGTEFDGSAPLVQYGYGAYGAPIDPYFDATRISLLDRGFVYAIAHIRGGNDFGRQWYYDGRQQNKINTFTDFIDVSNFLIDEGYTSSDRLFAVGASAGGLLTGAVANMAPELYQGVVVQVPFLDVVTTMADPSIPLTSSEWEEWGDPRDKDDYEYMLSYSPYDQIKAQDYPNLMVTGGLHDSQVQYFEPAKWVAKLRDYKTDDNLLLFYTDMDGGHSGKTGRYNVLWDYALEYVFYLKLAGITE